MLEVRWSSCDETSSFDPATPHPLIFVVPCSRHPLRTSIHGGKVGVHRRGSYGYDQRAALEGGRRHCQWVLVVLLSSLARAPRAGPDSLERFPVPDAHRTVRRVDSPAPTAVEEHRPGRRSPVRHPKQAVIAFHARPTFPPETAATLWSQSPVSVIIEMSEPFGIGSRQVGGPDRAPKGCGGDIHGRGSGSRETG